MLIGPSRFSPSRERAQQYTCYCPKGCHILSKVRDKVVKRRWEGHFASAVHFAVNLATGSNHWRGKFRRCTIGDWWLRCTHEELRLNPARLKSIRPRMILVVSRQHEYIGVADLSERMWWKEGDFNGQRFNKTLWDSESFSRQRNYMYIHM